jgi:1,4-alpha-glucan branching enzyme
VPNGYLCLILHAHLPYIRHPEFPEFIEERWLFEAVRESYLPLLRVLRKRRDLRSASRLTVSLSPHVDGDARRLVVAPAL